MTATVVTLLLIGAIVSGVSYYAYRRVTKISRANKEREQARAAALLSEVAARRGAGSAAGFAGSGLGVASGFTKPTASPVSPVAPVVPVAAHPPAKAIADPAAVSPPSIENDFRAFFGDAASPTIPGGKATPVPDASSDEADAVTTGVNESAPDSGEGPAASISAGVRFDIAAAHLAQALRDAASEVERVAASDGTPQERAVRTLTAVTASIGALPLGALVASGEDPDAP